MKHCRASSSQIFPLAIIIASLLICLFQQYVAEGFPIINGHLDTPWQGLPFKRSVRFLRDPMPWEDGYFDPAYHAWPKSRQQLGDKQSVKLTSDESVEGVSKQKGSARR